MPGSSVTSDSSRGCDHHDRDQEPGTLYSLEPETDPEMLPRLGPKMEGARQNNCSKHVLISLGLHLDRRRRIRNFTRIETDRDWTERRARAGGRTDYVPCHPPWLGPDSRDNKSLDATNDDDVSVSPSHYVPDPINGYKLEAQKLVTKTRAFQAFVFCTLD